MAPFPKAKKTKANVTAGAKPSSLDLSAWTVMKKQVWDGQGHPVGTEERTQGWRARTLRVACQS